MTHQELIEKMENARDKYWDMKQVLSVVKANIGSVAIQCPQCDNGCFIDDDSKQTNIECPKCYGSGVTSKEDV